MSPAADTSLASNLVSRTSPMTSQEDALDELDHADASGLRVRWRDLFGRNAPARLGTELLRRAIAYRLQELERGGLTRQAHLRLKVAAGRPGKNAGTDAGPTPTLFKPGTRFVREWQNEAHEVLTIDTGDFIYRGRTYRSLSLIAREITGTHQSGPRFFGITKNDATTRRREAVNG